MPQRTFSTAGLKPIRIKKKNMEEIYLCPFCKDVIGTPDTKGHLFVNKEKGKFNCFRCGSAGILATGNYTPTVITQNTFMSREAYIPDGFVSLNEVEDDFFPFMKEYAIKRGLTKEDIKRYNVGFSVDFVSPFWGRLIFCSYNEDGELEFVQGRSLFDNIEPRYLSCGNRTLFKSFEGKVNEGILTEGFFDMISASKYFPSAALSNSKVSDSKILKKIKGSFQSVILILDPDAIPKIISFLRRIKIPTSPIILRYKDLSEMPHKKLEQLMLRLKGEEDGSY